MADEKTRREIAYKIRICDLKKSLYCKQEGWLPNYVQFKDKKVSRVNIIGTVILSSNSPQQNVLVIDDGTDQIETRTFENDADMSKFNVGDIINLIGRVREFSNEKYIAAEIIKKVDNARLLELRKKEILLDNLAHDAAYDQEPDKPDKSAESQDSDTESKIFGAYEKLIHEIRSLDDGSGASIQDALVNSNLINGEELIMELLQRGDIFEISPGKVKILE